VLDRDLPVFRGIAISCAAGPLMFGNRPQRCNNVARLIQAERVCVRYATRLGSGNVTDATSAGDPTT